MPPRNPRLGVVYLNLAQYVDAGVITRRYLLRQSTTNATLKVSQSFLSCRPLTRRHSSPSTSNTLQANSATWPLRSPKARSSPGSLASSNRPTFTAPARTPRTSTRATSSDDHAGEGSDSDASSGSGAFDGYISHSGFPRSRRLHPQGHAGQHPTSTRATKAPTHLLVKSVCLATRCLGPWAIFHDNASTAYPTASDGYFVYWHTSSRRLHRY
jgi:hypothetical protein